MQKFIDFIKNLFASIFGAKETVPTPLPNPQDEFEAFDDDFDNLDDIFVDTQLPQDGADLNEDTETVVVEIKIPDVPSMSDDMEDSVGGTEGTHTEEDTSSNDLPPATPVEVEPSEEETAVDTEEETTVQVQHKKRFLWCLDNGHGQFTKGKRSPVFEGGGQFLEYEFNRDIVRRITEQLDQLGIAYFNVVPEVKIDNFLAGRVKRANSKSSDLPKLYVSIHANAAPAQSSKHWTTSTTAKGIETWFYKSSNKGKKLATVFQKHIVQATGWKNRNIKATKKLYVLRKTKMTSVLTENGFYNHPKEAKLLMQDKYRQKIADAHVKAIQEIEKNGL